MILFTFFIENLTCRPLIYGLVINYCCYRVLYAVFGWSILIVVVCWKNENKLVNLPFSLS